jgi:SAM-dependent methyltransferase
LSAEEPKSSARFSSRVADYVRYRPSYPADAIEFVVSELALDTDSMVADLGAGTGLLTKPLAETGALVFAVDPNAEMLDAAAEYLDAFDNVRIVPATAEHTTLDAHSLDAITAGQAFHWFDHGRVRVECLRVLRPGGRVALLWNAKAFDTSPFLGEYETLLDQHAPEFATVRHETSGDDEIAAFFGHPPTVREFANEQRFDWDGVLGRVMSSSYAPQPGQPGHDALVTGLRELFERYAAIGVVTWPYRTMVYVGEILAPV